MTVEKTASPAVEPRHRWGEPVRLPDRTERTCAHCGLVKITMHPPHGLPWREWRHRNGASIPLTNTPPCLAAAEETVP
ncbi:MAG TPA: hypothetical protein VKW08_07925 [Xanthobacteraceae bacterium]|nr:hypothetical protein [Xanthobacteraceae bacterium]